MGLCLSVPFEVTHRLGRSRFCFHFKSIRHSSGLAKEIVFICQMLIKNVWRSIYSRKREIHWCEGKHFLPLRYTIIKAAIKACIHLRINNNNNNCNVFLIISTSYLIVTILFLLIVMLLFIFVFATHILVTLKKCDSQNHKKNGYYKISELRLFFSLFSHNFSW